jgi:hypothetical protein
VRSLGGGPVRCAADVRFAEDVAEVELDRLDRDEEVAAGASDLGGGLKVSAWSSIRERHAA